MEEKKETYGNLFGTIEILSEEHLEVMLSSMDKDSATYFVVEALKAAHKRGAFTIGEVEVVSRAIRSISRND